MNLSEPFVRRPIGTILLTVGVALAGIGAFFNLPVSPLPQVDFPTVSVSAQLPGASPETMATSVATPLERHLGLISNVTEMTSSSRVGTANVTLQFEGLARRLGGGQNLRKGESDPGVSEAEPDPGPGSGPAPGTAGP